MGDFNDGEYLPDPEALASFRHSADTKMRSLGRVFWSKLDLSAAKAADLIAGRQQRDAVTRLIKDDLAQKLQTFNILYYVTFFFVLFLVASMSRYSPDPGASDKLKILVASNGAYFCFIMLLSLFYELARKVKWPLTVAAFLFIMLWPVVHERVVMLVSLKVLISMVVTIGVPGTIIFFNVTHMGKRLLTQLENLRKRNQAENSNRAEFVKHVERILSARGNKLGVILRRMFLRSAAHVAFSILTCDDCVDKQGALLDFAKRHKFKDSMGRLSGAVWIGGALIYLILPQIPEIEMISAAAAGVLPVYYVSMLIMNQLDEARDEALADVAELIKPNA